MIYWLLSSFLCGLLLFILFIFLFYWFYIKQLPKQQHTPIKPQFEDFFITPVLQELLTSDNHGAIAGLNVLLQFLFQELKDSGSVRNYIIRKMTIEFKELLTTKSIGKIIEKITARDFSLGTGCPVLSSIKLDTFKIDKQKLIIQEFSLLFDIEYVDGFSISVDVDLILGRSAYVHIKIANLKGKMKLFFTREPFTHWYIAFTEDPDIQFAVSSHFESRQIPQLTTLIMNQLRRSVRKKHTLPNYKIRFKPFFDQLLKINQTQSQLSSNRNKKLPKYINNANGKLTVNLQSFDHFNESSLLQYQDTQVYLTIGLDKYSLEYLLKQKTNKTNWAKYEIEIPRTNLAEQIGITFVETFFLTQTEVVINKVLPNTLASNPLFSLKQFDILVSINGIKVTSLKTAQRLIKNSLGLKMQFQRPQLYFKDSEAANPAAAVSVTTPVLEKKLNPQILTTPTIDSISSLDSDFVNVDATVEESKASTKSKDENPTPVKEIPIDAHLNVPTPSASLSTTPPQNTTTMQLVVNTRQRLGQKFSSFRKGYVGNLAQNPVEPASSIGTADTPLPSVPTITTTTHSNTTTTATTAPAPTNITNFASVNSLLEFYCAVAENGVDGNSNDIDLMYLTTYDLNSKEDYDKRQLYYKKTKKCKLDTNNLSVINFDEVFEFALNEDTVYVNLCLWVSTTNKAKARNILVGYISVPINDINAECWSTMKGEAKQLCYFKPIDTKASAISRTHSHVLSSHPGFDSSYTYGAITLLFQHVMKNEEQPQPNMDASQSQGQTEGLIKNTVHEIVNSLMEDGSKTCETSSDVAQGGVDDKYSHKFVSRQYNESVFCGYCSKKIWFKNAYRCAFCHYIIHVKCYEKAIGTTICPRYLKTADTNDNVDKLPNDVNSSIAVKTSDSIKTSLSYASDSNDNDNDGLQSKKLSTESHGSTAHLDLINTKRSVVTNLITGLRQRKWSKIKEKFQMSTLQNAERDSEFEIVQREGEKLGDSSIDTKSMDTETSDVYQDAQVNYLCDDKSMGIELCDDLPLNERKLKLEEMIFKYQSTIDMMKKLKEDLENDLKIKENGKNSFNDLKLKEQIRSQIKHLEDQMKSVMFLLMQCQVGVEHCQELLANGDVLKDE